jgi:hypothetical protein
MSYMPFNVTSRGLIRRLFRVGSRKPKFSDGFFSFNVNRNRVRIGENGFATRTLPTVLSVSCDSSRRDNGSTHA